MSKIDPILSLQNIHKSFCQGKRKLSVLQGASLEIHKGESIALIGPSGCGKTTLLQIAGLLDKPTKGHVFFNNHDMIRSNDAFRTSIRLMNIGFIYQLHHLLPEFTAMENIIIPQMIAGGNKKEAKEHAQELLKYLGLGARIDHKPSQLSGGEQQRVAIARALINRPSLLLADEPTGNLDPKTSQEVFDLLKNTAKKVGVAMLIVTHNPDLAKQMDKAITIEKGKLCVSGT
ncbi:ABC transporter ATP-binding protein [Rickettsiales bacterium]|nr:ABC transporter ATP-binding protein [Rickettsiales bacterium]